MDRRTWLLVGVLVSGCSSSSATPPPDAGADAATAGDAGGKPCERPGLPVPADPGAKGPWAVGAKTVTVGGLVHEVWYPSAPGTAGANKVYDLRDQLSPEDAAKIPPEKAPKQVCDCFEGLPIDAAHGPYPTIVFFHGTAGFRTQSLSQMTHWASRGFIVVATDHPKLKLADALQLDVSFNADFGANSNVLLDAIAARAAEVSFLGTSADLGKLGAVGHSAGGGAAARFTRAGIRVRIPMAAGGTTASPDLVSTLVLSAERDTVVVPKSQADGFASSPKSKRFAVLARAGHLAFSDICETGKENGGLLNIAKDAGIFVPDLLLRLGTDGCGADDLPPADAHKAVSALTTFVLENALSCGPSTGFADVTKNLGPILGTVSEEL
ncbi:MAG: hypothetical protein HOO96_32195 [Polyangiaceae bacterium]|nr:hypothetical protein [Polyangiaceae bacterium]